MAKYTHVDDPVTPQERAKWTRERHKEVGISTLPVGFSFKPRGRDGFVYYQEEDRVLELYWEMSGVPQFDILLNLEGLKQWAWPKVEPTSEADQIRVRSALTDWLKAIGYRAELSG